MKRHLIGLAFLALLAGCRSEPLPTPGPETPTPTIAPSQTAPPPSPTPLDLQVEPVDPLASFPVAMDFAPDGRLFYLSRARGALLAITLEKGPGGEVPPPVTVLSGLPLPRGQGDGPLGLALSPNFENDHHFFVYYTDTNARGDPQRVPIVRYTEVDGVAAEETVVVDQLPVHPEQRFHFGGGLSFGPDGKLYLIYGDTDRPPTARDPEHWGGSVLRFNPDGTIPEDNPFPGSPVYSYGHRNGFGLAWHPETGALYESENGQTCDDELNLIQPGADYGWGAFEASLCPYPDDVGVPPLYQWTPNVAPTGITFYTADVIPAFTGDLLVCGFNLGRLLHVRLSEDGQAVESVEVVQLPDADEVCTLDVLQGPDGWLYTSTTTAIYRIGR